jgi:hypothetical protein
MVMDMIVHDFQVIRLYFMMDTYKVMMLHGLEVVGVLMVRLAEFQEVNHGLV